MTMPLLFPLQNCHGCLLAIVKLQHPLPALFRVRAVLVQIRPHKPIFQRLGHVSCVSRHVRNQLWARSDIDEGAHRNGLGWSSCLRHASLIVVSGPKEDHVVSASLLSGNPSTDGSRTSRWQCWQEWKWASRGSCFHGEYGLPR